MNNEVGVNTGLNRKDIELFVFSLSLPKVFSPSLVARLRSNSEILDEVACQRVELKEQGSNLLKASNPFVIFWHFLIILLINISFILGILEGEEVCKQGLLET